MPDPVHSPGPGPSRRAVVGTAVAAAGLLAPACARAAPAPATNPVPTPGPTTSTPRPLGPISEVPVGGAKVYPDREVVVTQPRPGEFNGFSAACPHQGCTVTAGSGPTVVCPCHGSTFGLDGRRLSGPARRGLRSREITVEGGQIVLG